jgi:hypothetical protein
MDVDPPPTKVNRNGEMGDGLAEYNLDDYDDDPAVCGSFVSILVPLTHSGKFQQQDHLAT